jgi:hypothetical protein
MSRATLASRIAAVIVSAAACTGASGAGRDGGGHGPGTKGDAACAPARDHAEALYRAELAARTPPGEPREATDNASIVAADCARDPRRVAACAAAATSVAQLERDCLIPIDDEGSEGRQFTAR